MIKKIYKDAPDVQLSNMTEVLREIANQNRDLVANLNISNINRVSTPSIATERSEQSPVMDGYQQIDSPANSNYSPVNYDPNAQFRPISQASSESEYFSDNPSPIMQRPILRRNTGYIYSPLPQNIPTPEPESPMPFANAQLAATTPFTDNEEDEEPLLANAQAKPIEDRQNYVFVMLYGKDFLQRKVFNAGQKRNLDYIIFTDGQKYQEPNEAYLMEIKSGFIINWPDDISYADLKKNYRVVKALDYRPPLQDTDIAFLYPNQSVPRDKNGFYISDTQLKLNNGNGYKFQKKKVKGGKLENFFNLTSFEKIYTNQQNARFTYLLTF
jgi:hypothetical protein